ncbi:DNA polymerase III subunit gamma/tau [Alishewanella longhuensis]|uniref:DNA polymerase III subunit gamma/tau n=1 Tax=Alishewanella longhuensis TaxID=1091037 RepID=A0ABQ3KX88_9ALTE|nr:DNA polymerase III subunit gamma/tau [Alishewanella longhuensis]GHG64472.1 DNA polymerase III subunit gamma/tau [Alishewanella longhuensis]
MSYQVLARKWRPRQFSELVGQQHVKTALANALSSSRLHHAYLFTGTRGVGKTTIARIFAKSLNCETGITATPCGHCSACQEIDAGNFVDLMEIDAASRTKVEDTRDLLDNVQYAPSRGRFKVYLIDEVHMLSRHSFNALLKTLEEPPPHVKFLLATTDPQKLPVTVLSRCLQFSLKALTVTQIEQHLAQVLTAEHIAFDSAALTLLAKAAKGSLRDSLSLTDQAIALTDSQLTVEPVRQMLGLLDSNWSVQLLAAMLAADINSLQQALQALLSQQSDYQQVLDDMLALLHLTALTQLQPAAAELSEQADFIRLLARQQTPEAIQLYYQLLLSGKKDLPFAPEPLIGLEMALLRAMAFVPAAVTNPAAGSRPERNASYVNSSAPNNVTERADLVINPTPQTVAPSPSVLVDSLSANAVAIEQTKSDAIVAESPVAVEIMPASTMAASSQDFDTGGMDPVSARIMQRRGLTLPPTKKDTDTQDNNIGKKPERPEAPLSAVSNQPKADFTETLPPDTALLQHSGSGDGKTERNSSAAKAKELATDDNNQDDDSVSFAEQQALTEAWWQQQSFMSLPAADADELDEQRFSIRFAAQVDPWARLIEQLPVGGLMRLFLLHSAMQQEGNTVKLRVGRSQRHLDKGEFRQKLYAAISPVFAAGFTLEISYQHELSDSPLAIQQRIEQERKDYVSRLLQQDPKVQAIQQRFAAQLQLDTLQVN